MAERKNKRVRGNGEGSVYQRASDGLFVAAITVAGDKVPVYGHTKREANENLRLLKEAEAKGSLGVLLNRQTVAEYLTGWLQTVKPELRPGTWKNYEQIVRLHAVPAIGGIKLTKLTGSDLGRLYAACREKGLTAVSVKHVHACLHSALADAVRAELLDRNPADHLPRKPQGKPPRRPVLATDEVRRLLSVASDHRLGAMVTLALACGLRAGELCGLRWQDVDLDAGSLTVRVALARQERGYALAEPKTENARRVLRLPQVAVEALRRRRQLQLEEKLRAGPTWVETGLVFTRASARWGSGQALGRGHLVDDVLRPLLRGAGLPDCTMHDLRHTYATIGLRQRVPLKVVSSNLGHSRIGVTADLYMESDGLGDMMAEAIDRVFSSDPGAAGTRAGTDGA